MYFELSEDTIHYGEYKVNRDQFESYVDGQNGRVWTMDHFDGFHTTTTGKMSWDEYYELETYVKQDLDSFIAKQHSHA